MANTPMALTSESESDNEESPLTRGSQSSSAPAAPSSSPPAPPATGAKGYAADFLALPPQVFVIFFLEFLNSYRNFGLRFVQYQYISNEFGMTDVQTGSLLGVRARAARATPFLPPPPAPLK